MTTTDRELLERAAKAAGMPRGEYCEPGHEPALYHSDYGFWQPLADDGDALRLAVALGLVVDCSRPSAGEPFKLHQFAQDEFQDIGCATRRAIVRAAAAMAGEGE